MDLLGLLAGIGFTDYEAKVYLELLKDYPVTGYKLSKDAGIPRSMVYEALGRLANRGAVLETREDRITLYRPTPPDVLLDLYEETQRQLAADLRAGLSLRYAFRDEDHLWSMTGDRSVNVYSFQMIRQARHKILAVLPDLSVKALREELTKAQTRGVEIYAVLTGEAQLGFGTTVRHPHQESELQQMTGMAILVADGSEVMIANAPGTLSETTATVTRNRNFLLIASQFVWMEMFTQRIQRAVGEDLLSRFSPEDRLLFENLLANSHLTKEGRL